MWWLGSWRLLWYATPIMFSTESSSHKQQFQPCACCTSACVPAIGLIHKNAEATARAIKIQNTVLRKVALANAGHVIRPGDVTWSVAFHRPVDAVAFCLQVPYCLAVFIPCASKQCYLKPVASLLMLLPILATLLSCCMHVPIGRQV